VDIVREVRLARTFDDALTVMSVWLRDLRDAGYEVRPKNTWHHSPDAPPEHFCEDCDRLRAEVRPKLTAERLQAAYHDAKDAGAVTVADLAAKMLAALDNAP